MVIEPLQGRHLDMIRVQVRQRWEFALWPEGALERLVKSGDAFAGVRGHAVLALAGVSKVWEGRYQAWSFLSRDCGPSGFVAVHRAVRSYLDQSSYRRIEATVESDFDEGHRWLRMLGMRCETPEAMVGYYPDGRSAYLYSRAGGRYSGGSAHVGD